MVLFSVGAIACMGVRNCVVYHPVKTSPSRGLFPVVYYCSLKRNSVQREEERAQGARVCERGGGGQVALRVWERACKRESARERERARESAGAKDCARKWDHARARATRPWA